MKRPRVTEAIKKLRRKARYAGAKVKAALSLPVEVAGDYLARLEAFEAAIVEYERAEDRTLEAEAVSDTKTEEVIKGVRRVASETKLECGNTIHAPLYDFLVPDGVPPFKRTTGRSAVETGNRLRERLTLGNVPPSIAAFADPLSTLVAGAEASVALLEEAQKVEEQARTRLESEKLLWIASYVALYFRLRAHFADQPELAETFFLHEARKAREGDVEEAPEDGKDGSGGDVPVQGATSAPATAEAGQGSAAA